MTSYRERHLAGVHTAEDAQPAEAEPLPGTHAKLDELAAERGHEWSDEGLTVAAKQAELGG